MNRRDVLLGAAALTGCTPAASGASQPAAPFPIRKAVNLGSALEAPAEGEWGYRIEDDHLTLIADAGFDGVRLPVRFSEYATSEAPYTLNAEIFDRVDHLIERATAAGLKVQLDLHHYVELVDHPEHRTRFLGIWRQIAAHYRSAPASVIYELWNEPNGEFWDYRNLSALQSEAIAAVREHDATRLIVLGSPGWNSIGGLEEWRPPPGDNIAVSVHYYEPHAFTHQNAPFLGADAPNFRRAWGTAPDRRTVQLHAEDAARWGAATGYAMQLGEFGTNISLSMAQRVAWTRTVREAFEAQGMGWAVWDFAGEFRIWDPRTGRFIPELLRALLG